jgi:hypothetical protein
MQVRDGHFVLLHKSMSDWLLRVEKGEQTF